MTVKVPSAKNDPGLTLKPGKISRSGELRVQQLDGEWAEMVRDWAARVERTRRQRYWGGLTMMRWPG